MEPQKKQIALALWKHDAGYLSGNLGPFEVRVVREDEGAMITIGQESHLLPEKTSRAGLVFFTGATKGFGFSMFKVESQNPRAPAYRLVISELPPREKPAPAKPAKSWDDTTGSVPVTPVAPIKPFTESPFTEEDVPF